MADLIRLAHNAVVAKLIGGDKDARAIVSKALSYMVEGVEHMSAFTTGGWNGRSSFFTHQSSSFPAGFVHMIHSELVRAGYKVQLIRSALPGPLGEVNPIVDEFGNDDPRYDYQMRTVDQLLKHGRGIAQIATGGGKSMCYQLPSLLRPGLGLVVSPLIALMAEPRITGALSPSNSYLLRSSRTSSSTRSRSSWAADASVCRPRRASISSCPATASSPTPD
jgi:hypothetical protein